MLVILDKTYYGESIVDIDRDISEMFNEEYDPTIATIPRDEHGFMKGSFHVRVKWIPDDAAE